MSMVNPRLIGLIRALRPCSVAVVGDVMLDRYVQGQVNRLSPEAPIQVLEVANEYKMPGGAANVAMKAVGLEARVRLVGLVGEDGPARELRALLTDQERLDDGLVADPARSTTVKTRFIAHNQQLLRVDHEKRGVPEGAIRDRLAAAAHDAAAVADAVILEDYGKGVLSRQVIEAAIAGARARGAPIVVDPNGRDYRRYAGATVLTPNLRETEIAAEMTISDEAGLQAAASLLVDQTAGAALAVTRESKGISLFRKINGQLVHTHVPTIPVAVYDVTGAGDAVAASLAIALASGIDLVDACDLANLAGRAVVRQFGVGTISIGHLVAEASESVEQAAKIVDLTRARQQAREVRRTGGKIVFTNGCFDVLHFGHAYLLQFARARGDFLVLGLNTDDSVRRQKGPGRPFVSEEQRAYMLSLYPFVDNVVLFDEDTPLALIEALRPDILVKGGDYTPDTVVGRDFIESYGGEVVICPRIDGLSTTDLVKKIRERSEGK
ncbi:MAG TPA: bifunctional heptose 7-phosphate kinase/heptose 1-phosphate adenyltransferase [Isosphaeraceae bacterium]|jgi:D-beta-D-heptose 7-phosphate kinase/D-beta-D-heptose 1-phosphate adenosyltransferase|nr:bifunctional heptose 7-phosphate kinase/heptose 1-phosphate adenyltransferase [Isosphaeraceae bacterium]